MIETNCLFLGFRIVLELDLWLKFLERVGGVGELIEVGKAEGWTVGVVVLVVVEVEGVQGVFSEVV